MNTCLVCGATGDGPACARCGAPWGTEPTPVTPVPEPPRRASATPDEVPLPPRRTGMSPVVPITVLLIALIMGAIIVAIYFLPKVVKSAVPATNTAGAVIPVSTATPTTAQPAQPAQPAAPSSTEPASPSPAPVTVPTAPDPALQPDCQKIAPEDPENCLAVWTFLHAYDVAQVNKNISKENVASFWSNPGDYFGQQLNTDQLFAEISAPAPAGTTYAPGSMIYYNTTSQNGQDGFLLKVDTPRTVNGQQGKVRLQYFLVRDGSSFRIVSEDSR